VRYEGENAERNAQDRQCSEIEADDRHGEAEEEKRRLEIHRERR